MMAEDSVKERGSAPQVLSPPRLQRQGQELYIFGSYEDRQHPYRRTHNPQYACE